MTTTPPPDTAVVRVSRGDFDPTRFAEVQAITAATGRYLVPVHVTFAPVVSYPVGWFS